MLADRLHHIFHSRKAVQTCLDCDVSLNINIWQPRFTFGNGVGHRFLSVYYDLNETQRLDALLTAQVGSAGAFTSRLASGDATIARAKKDSAGWDLRLASKEAALRKQYTAMETALSGAQSQGQWLSGQIAKL